MAIAAVVLLAFARHNGTHGDHERMDDIWHGSEAPVLHDRVQHGSTWVAARLAAGGGGNGRVWLQALGNGGKVDRDADSVLKHSTQGLIMGADWRIDEQWHVGLMGAKAQTRFDARQFDGDLDSWHLGAYAVRQDGPLALRLGATYASHDGSSKRRVAFNGFSDRLKGNWGIVDVDDCANGAKFLADKGLVDGDRLAISGGSAGGVSDIPGVFPF